MGVMRSHRGIHAACILAMLTAGAARFARGLLIVNGQVMMQQQWAGNQGMFFDDDDDFYSGNSGVDYQSRYQQRLRNQINNIFQEAQPGADKWSRRQGIESSLTALGDQALPVLQEQEASRSGLDLDAVQVAEFRIENDAFAPEPIVQDWALDHFHYTPNLEAPPTPPPIKILRIVNLAPGNMLFPHHLFYVIQWLPTRARLPVALATDGKVQTLENDETLARFLRAEGGEQHTRAGKELLASMAVFLALARTDDLQDHPIPHAHVEGATATASLSAPAPQIISLKFDASELVESVTSKR